MSEHPLHFENFLATTRHHFFSDAPIAESGQGHEVDESVDNNGTHRPHTDR